MAQSREQARLAERRRQERRAARQAESLHQKKVRSVIGAVVAVLLLVGAVVAITLTKNTNKGTPAGAQPTATDSASGDPTAVATDDPTAVATDASSPPAPASPAGVACGATAPKAAAPQTFKAEPPLTIDPKAAYVATIKTSCGTITLDMDAAKAPHTVNSWAFLADKKFWDGTFCHRMTSGDLNVLQCGDPEGTGGGGPGYTIAEENLTGATYGKGVVAMAKTQAAHSTGSQFFINYADSALPPQYTVVGKVTADSMAVLDKIKAVGITGGAPDGAPAQKIFLDSVTVAKK